MRSNPKYSANPTATPPASPSGTPPRNPSLPAPPAAMPNRNSTISEPSRSTASATTASKIAIELDPDFTESVTRCICCTISLPWLDIQVTCQPIITTAASNTAASKTSWPTPPSEPSMRPMHAATTTAPITPNAMPPPTNTLRRGTPRVAAATTVTISAASSTSRNTNSAIPSTIAWPLLHDQHAGGGLVEIVEELVTALRERPDEDRDRGVRQHDLFPVEVGTLEFRRRRVAIGHQHLELGIGGHLQHCRFELVVLQDQVIFGRGVGLRARHGGGTCKTHDDGPDQLAHWHEFHAASTLGRRRQQMLIVLIYKDNPDAPYRALQWMGHRHGNVRARETLSFTFWLGTRRWLTPSCLNAGTPRRS